MMISPILETFWQIDDQKKNNNNKRESPLKNNFIFFHSKDYKILTFFLLKN